MKKRVSTIVRCADLLRHVYGTVASIERQVGGPGQIVLVSDDSTPAAARDWLRHFAREKQLVLAHSTAATPGAVWNAGIRASDSKNVLCIDAGDRLDRRCHSVATARLDGDRRVDLVTSAVLISGPGARTRTIAPAGTDLEALIADPEAIHTAAMFRRSAWSALHGFDEALPSLDHYDFALRLLQAGRRIAAVDAPLLLRVHQEGLLYRRAWDRDRHVEAVKAIVAKHATLFRGDPAAALYARERTLRKLGDEYRRLMASRADGLQELERLKNRAADLRRTLGDVEAGAIELGDLRRRTPVSRDWGYERGRPIDRYYIEQFIASCAADIKGAVLEVQESDYTVRFGGGRVTRSDVLDLDASNPRATIVGDLRSAPNIPAEAFDCIILTQTLHVVDDMRAVLGECVRILKPGGVLLATLPSASRVCLEYGQDGDFWRVTEAGARRIFAEVFPADALEISAQGNVLANTAFLYGLGCHELSEAEFEAADPYFPLIVNVRAQKSGPAKAGHYVRDRRSVRLPADRTLQPRTGRADSRAAILLYHRVASPASDVHRLAIAPDEFRSQMEHLRQHYRPMPLEELAAAAVEHRLEGASVAITFDDGYVDNYTTASPILSELGVPATFFLTTDHLDQEYEFWWDTLEHVLLAPSTPPLLTIELPDGPRTFETATTEGRSSAHAAVYAAIVGASVDIRDETIRKLVAWHPLERQRDTTRRRMKRAEMRALARRKGHSVGAHTVRHLMLPRQAADVQRNEIDASRRTLEALVAKPIKSFAYPFGAFSDETVRLVERGKFEFAVTCEDRLVEGGVDPFRLPRLEVTARGQVKFDEWLAGRFSAPSGSR